MDLKNEATQIIDETAVDQEAYDKASEKTDSFKNKKNASTLKRAATAAAAGVAMGAAAPIMMGMSTPEAEIVDETGEESDSLTSEDTLVKDPVEINESSDGHSVPTMTIESPTHSSVNSHVGHSVSDISHPSDGAESEIEILGIEQTDAGDIIGTVNVDGTEAVVIDVNGDMMFDAVGIDFNGDGVIDESEIIELSRPEISAEELGYNVSSVGDADPVDLSGGSDYANAYDPEIDTNFVESDVLYDTTDEMMLADTGMDGFGHELSDDFSADFYGA